MKKVLPGICIQSLITIFCLTISFEPVSAQEGYLRSLPSQDYQSIADMQVTATGEMHIAATSFLYRLNNAGEIALQKEIKEGSYSEIRAAIPTVDGGDAVLLHALENMTTERLVFFHLSADGNLSGRKVVSDIGSHDQVKMKKLGADHYLVTFKKWVTATSAVVWAIYLNASGDKIWETTVTERMFNVYNVVEVNDRIELQYRKKDHPGASLVRITAQGPIETVDFVFSNNVTESDYLTHFDRLADGSYVIAGLHSPNSLKYDDIVLIRTNANGEETAVKRIDIYQRELMHQVKVVADGILLLAASGHGSWGDSNRGDILIIKTDFDGNELWRKAFSSQSADIGYLLAVHSNSIYMTGRMNVIGGSTDTPVAMKLNNEGSLPDDFPFETASSDDLKDFNTGLNDDMQTLVAAIAGANNNVILGMNRLDKPNDRLLPAVLCTQMGGSVAWSLPFPLDAGELKVLSRIRQGDNLVITEKRDLFGNVYNITQFDDEGKIGWTYQTGASHLRTAIRTRDGGYLLVGDHDISFVNYEALLIKLNANGQVQWRNVYGVHGKWELPRSVIETPEGDFIVAGASLLEFDIAATLYALRVGQDGQLKWKKELGTGVVEENAFAITRTADGNYMVGGFHQTYPFDNRDLLLATFTGDGQMVNRNTIQLHLHDEIQSMLTLANGGHLVVGNTSRSQWGAWQQRSFVMQLTAQAQAAKTVFYGEKSQYLNFSNLIVTSNQDTLVVGTRQPYYGFSRPIYMKWQTGYVPAPPPPPPPPPTALELYIYPNPSSSTDVKLRWSGSYQGLAKIHVFNAKGQNCYSRILYKDEPSIQYQLPAVVAAGLYLVRIEYGSEVKTVKWLHVGNRW